MNSCIRVSVVMSVFNGGNWLKYSVESILNQTFRDFEFIIVDDGSTDSSIDILNYYQSIDKRIKIIRKKNTGLYDSLNVGIKSAESEWIARIDSDDTSESTRLEKQYHLALKLGKKFIIGTNLNIIDSNGSIVSEYKYPKTHKGLKNNLLTLNRFFATSSAFFNFSIFEKLGGYRLHYKRSGDYDFWLRALSKGYQFRCLQQPLVFIRKHENSLSSSNNGLDSVVYSTCALTCFHLRKNNILDPADIYNVNEYETHFKEMVISELKKSSILNEKNSFLRNSFYGLTSNPIYIPMRFFYKYLNKIFSFINVYKRVRIANNIADHYNLK